MTADQIKQTADEALNLLPGLLFEIIPGGRLVGKEYTCSDLSGGLGKSCKVNVTTGKWSDFATDEGGGDLVSLLAAIRRYSQSEAAQELAEKLGTASSLATQEKPIKSKIWSPVFPVPDDAPLPPMSHPRHGKPVQTWSYLSEAGDLLQIVNRFDNPDGKEFCPLTYCTDGSRYAWRWQALHAPRPLYGLELIRSSEYVLIVEGEKPAVAARRLLGVEIPVVTWPGGANSSHNADWSPLAGKTVAIWPDADPPGIKAALAVAEAVQAAGASAVKIVVLPDNVDTGWDLADAEAECWTRDQVLDRLRAGLSPEEFRARLMESAVQDADVATAEQEVLPEKYVRRPDGIYYEVERKDGGIDYDWVCSHIEVRAMTRSAEGKDWGRLLVITDADGIDHWWPMPMGTMSGSGEEYRRELLSQGLRIAAGKGVPRLHDFLSLSNPKNRVRCVLRIGWHGRCFVLPDTVLGEADGEPVLLQGSTGENRFLVAGTLEDWQKSVGQLCVGNSRLVFSVSAALAGPLLYPVNAESGGFHLIGGSSMGKTTALRVGGSVCGGGGLRGYIRQWRATDNGLEAVATGHCDTLLCLDEMSQVDGHTAGEVAYMLANGQGKVRARRDGKGRSPQEWRTLFLSTGEVGLAEKVAEDGRKKITAGQAVRVVDIPADAGVGLGLFEDLHGAENGDQFARKLGDATEKTYGAPLRSFLQQLSLRLDEATPLVTGFIKEFVEKYCPKNANGQVRRVCARFGLVAAAGELGIVFGVLPWPPDEAKRAAMVCFQAWLDRRGGSGAAEVQAGIAQVVAFFEAHGTSRFEVWGSGPSENKIINRAGLRRKNENGEWDYYVFPSTLKEHLCRGFDVKMLLTELCQQGMLIPGENNKFSKSLSPPGFGKKIRLYHFSADVLGGGGRNA